MAWQAFFRQIVQSFGFLCYLVRRRVFIEDALKFLFEQEESGVQATSENLARSLALPTGCAHRILKKLIDLKFVRESPEGIVLSDTGRHEALRIVRLHRLWEKYLAEETGLDPGEWHTKAHALEHVTSQAVAGGLVARLGDPRFDPHGDPIPTESGEIKTVAAKPIATTQAGDLVEITHLEDEPVSVFRDLLDQGLHLGAQLQVQRSSEEETVVRHHGETVVLSPEVARNVYVRLISEQEFRFSETKPVTLAELNLQEEGVVIGFAPACRGLARRRLLDLGFVPGTRVRAELSSIGGDPTAFRVRNTLIALRKSQAALILISMG
ncbi:MAG: metal-dependent transcriptional regulator [Thermogutta sp.]